MTSTAPSTHAEAAPESNARPVRINLVIGLLVASSFVVILNETIMSVALPRLMIDLSISAATAQWLTTAFMLTMAIVIPVTGQLMERFSTRTVFIGAMSLFTLGTLIAACAPGFGLLVTGRVVQAIGTAVMIPLLMTTVLTFVPADKRGRMMGVITIVISVAPAIGPTVSGFILDALTWRWMFIIVLPIAVASLVIGTIFVQNVSETRRVRFDLLSLTLSALAFGGLIYGLSSFGEAAEGNAPVAPFIPIAIGVLALAGFVLRQIKLQREDRPLLDLRVFANRTFTLALVLALVSMGALFGVIIVLPLYLQNVLGIDARGTGLMLLPGGLVMGVAAPFVGQLYDRFGPRPLVTPGAILVSGALWGLTFLDERTPPVAIIGLHVVLSLGLSLVFTPLFTAGLGSLPKQRYGHGSAVLNTLQQVAGAAGTALFITVMSLATASSLAAERPEITAVADGVHAAFVCGAVISLLPVVSAWLVGKPREQEEAAETAEAAGPAADSDAQDDTAEAATVATAAGTATAADARGSAS